MAKIEHLNKFLLLARWSLRTTTLLDESSIRQPIFSRLRARVKNTVADLHLCTLRQLDHGKDGDEEMR